MHGKPVGVEVEVRGWRGGPDLWEEVQMAAGGVRTVADGASDPTPSGDG